MKETSMQVKRGISSAIRLSKDKWWIIGGFKSFLRPVQSTEVYDANLNSFSDFVDLPEEIHFTKILSFNKTHLVLVTNTKFYLFNK